MNYCKGDMVRIRTDLQVGSSYGDPPIGLNFDMQPGLGCVWPVTDVMEEEQAVKAGGWWWSTDMIELIAPAIQKEHWIPTSMFKPTADKNDTRYPVICQSKNGRQSVNLAWIDENGNWHGQGSMANVTHWAPPFQLPDPIE